MEARHAAKLAALGCCLFFGGCGGGGGSGSNTVSPPTQAVSFSPASMTMSIAPGISYPFLVQTTVNKPSAFAGVSTLYVYVIDPNKLLTGTVALTSVDSLHYNAILETSPSLALGNYQGAFQIELCADSACNTQIPGSPFSLPYNLTVTNCLPNIGMSVGGSTTASFKSGGPAPQDIAVTVAPNCQSWTASTTTSWLRVIGGAGSGPGTFTVSFLPNGLAVGSYSGSVTLNAADGQSVSMTFGLTVSP